MSYIITKNDAVIKNGCIINYLGAEKDIVIPEYINGELITEIGDYAFECNKLTSVVIPDSVTEIGVRAFDKNEDLKSIKWGDISYPVRYFDGYLSIPGQTYMMKFENLEVGALGLVQQQPDGSIKQIGLTHLQSKALQIFVATMSADQPLVLLDKECDLILKRSKK